MKSPTYTKAGHWFSLAAVTAGLSAITSQNIIPLLVAAAAGYMAYHYYKLHEQES